MIDATTMDRKVDSRAMREVNRSIIYDLIRKGEDISRTELAKISLLTKPTVSTIVEELLAEGIVSEVGFTKSEPTGGRRARLLRFNSDSAAYLGIRLGVQSISVALADGRGSVIGTAQIPVVHDDAPGAVNAAIEAAQKLLKDKAIPPERLQHVGVAVGGLVDVNTGHCVLSPNLGWKDVPLRELVSAGLGVTTSVFNVTEAAAFAEMRLGAAREYSSFVWVYAGTGIGAAIVCKGQVFHGRRGFAGEIGFCRMSAGGPILEEIASKNAILKTALSGDLSGETAVNPDSTAADILALAEQGNETCLGAVQKAGAALGLAVAHLVNITNPEVVVLGGGVAEQSPSFVRAVNEAVQKEALGPEAVSVVSTELSGKSVTYGAVLLAQEQGTRSVRIVSSND